MSDLTLRILRNTDIKEVYKTLLLGNKVSVQKQEAILKLGILLLNSKNPDVAKLGYRIILFYSNLYENYTPLYEVSINKGYVPVAKLIEKMPKYARSFKERFLAAFTSSFKESFVDNGKYLTFQQLELNEKFKSESPTASMAVIAPTSYGKSELILSGIAAEPGNVCVIVPTKALIAQTKRRILNSEQYDATRPLVTHPEMYREGAEGVVAILTQERLLRLLQKHNDICFELIFVDEAHNLLEDTDRTRLLASVIIILHNRRTASRFQFLTPFLIGSTGFRVGRG